MGEWKVGDLFTLRRLAKSRNEEAQSTGLKDRGGQVRIPLSSPFRPLKIVSLMWLVLSTSYAFVSNLYSTFRELSF